MLLPTLKSAVLAGLLAFSPVTARSDLTSALTPRPGISFKLTKSHRSSTPDKVTSNFQYLHAHRGAGSGTTTKSVNTKSVASILGAHQRAVGGTGYQNITSSTAYGTQYAVDVLFADQPLKLLLDTGSSDTWIVQSGYSCVDFAEEPVDQASCGFGPAYEGGFQYGAIPDQHIYIQYGDGEVIYGPVGFSDITLGNITVKKQEAGLANQTYWFGNNVTSGVLGLAYPSITNAYLGTGEEHNWLDAESYSPVFSSMVNQGLVAPFFSIAINRNSSGGLIAWGGIPPVKGLDYSTAVSMDIVIVCPFFLPTGPFTNMSDQPHRQPLHVMAILLLHHHPRRLAMGPDNQHAQIPLHRRLRHNSVLSPSRYVPRPTLPLPTLFIPQLLTAPADLAEAINSAYDPPATYLWMYGAFFTKCNARAPILAVVMHGARFYINPVDLVFQDLVDPLTGLCMTGIASGGTGPYILGDVFLTNALAVFDTGRSQMRFISRQFY